MPDPVITPLAAFGLAMTILNYLLNTIKSLHEKGFEIRDFESIIKTYINIIRSCRAKYTTWKDIWDKQDYLRVFGIDGSIAVNQCKLVVEELIVETVRTLRLEAPAATRPEMTSRASNRIALDTNTIFKRAWKRLRKLHRSKRESVALPTPPRLGVDRERWQRTVDFSPQQRPDTDRETRPHMLWRVIGILGPNAHLKEQISRLKDNVDALPEIARDAYRRMGHGAQPTSENDVARAANARYFQDVTRMLKRCMSSRDGDKDYFLELHFPNEAADSRNALDQIMWNCEIRFFARPSPAGLSLARELKMKRLRGIETSHENGGSKPAPFDLAVSHLKPILEASIMDSEFRFRWAEQIPVAVTKTWEVLLSLCVNNPVFLKALELERARFAHGLVLWFILLWETDWFDHVCACGFRSVDFQPTSDREPVIAHEPARDSVVQEFVYHAVLPSYITGEASEAESQAAQEALPTERQVSCRGQTSNEHRLYHLGILLAELGHGVPISLDSDISHDPLIRSHARGKPIGKFATYEDILSGLPAQLQKAIRFCFDNATEPKWIADDQAAAYRVDEFLSNVVGPVDEYYEQVRANAKKVSFDAEFAGLEFERLRQDLTFKRV